MAKMHSEGGQPQVAYEFELVKDEALIFPTPTETSVVEDPSPPSVLAPTPTQTENVAEGPGFPFIDRKGYTPTGTEVDPCIISVEPTLFGNTLNLELRTRGYYHHWFYKVGNAPAVLTLGVERTSVGLEDGTHTIKIWLTNHHHAKFSDPCTETEITISVNQTLTKTHVIQHCDTKAYLKVLHRKEISALSYMRITSGDYVGCWVFTNLDESQVSTLNAELHDFSHVTVANNPDIKIQEDACACCVLKVCPELYIDPITKGDDDKDNDDPYPTPTGSAFLSFPSITCSAELIVKHQEAITPTHTVNINDEKLVVYGDRADTSKNAELLVLGCPRIQDRDIYYVWVRRSDSCEEEWMNGGEPFLFEHVTEYECDCTPYLSPKTPYLADNLSLSPLYGEEQIPSLKLKSDESPVYVVHILISGSKDAVKAGLKPVGFYDRYLDENATEVTTSLMVNNNTDLNINPTNLYLSPSDKNANYFNALHVLDVGKTLTHINRIYFSETLPF